MSNSELERLTMDCLVYHMPVRTKKLIHDLLRDGATVEGVRDALVWHTRRIAGRKHTFTELSIEEYLDRIARGEIDPKEEPK